MDIKWSINHDYGYKSYMLIGDYNGTRFVEGVREGFFGMPLRYKKWLIKLNFKILNKNNYNPN